jgi:dephospho-CoA kinase
LYESESHKAFDFVIAVVADAAFSKSRFEKSTGYLTGEYERRMQRQLPMHEKAAKADFVIKNNGSMEDLKKSVKEVYTKLKGVSP